MVPEVLELWEMEANCAQATAKGLLQHFRYEDASDVLFNSFFPYGGGFKERSICGAVSGTLAALSYICSQRDCTYDEIIALADLFKEKFTTEFGSLRCREILAPFHLADGEFDMDNPERRDRCTRAVDLASQLANILLTGKSTNIM
ncbi:MAG: C-GCAxxG-C-C family (seleno)protein [Promethearchaeota archaeon]